ncbi:MAG: methyltransferase domain-containing protein [Proteobacteria bacterium]|nr:methyltransferase domain-containing protein [Pseudomonadota bacterium]
MDKQSLEKNASSFLVENINLLPKGRVLDIAMGEGRNSIYLASLGFKVQGIDISEEAIKIAEKNARQSGVDISTHVVDLEKDTYITEDSYDVIICFNYLQRSLIPKIKAGLCTGGFVVYETFIIDQIQFGKPHNPDFLLKHNELLDMFRDFRCLRYHEGIVENQKAVAGIIAQKI